MKTKQGAVKVVQGFYSVKEAAGIAKCSEQTIKRVLKAGDLKALQPTGPRGTILIPQGNLVAWLTSREYGSEK
jgi:excisionase family DNA binding protein